MKTFLSASLGVFLVMTLTGCQKTPAAADQLPRYRFTPGQRLTFEGPGEFKFQSGSFLTEGNTKIWVIRQNGDGSWHLVARSENSMYRAEPNSTVKEPENTRVSWTRGDVYPDGHADHVESTDGQSQSMPEIIPLPKSDQEAKDGWSRTGDETQGSDRFSIAPGNPVSDRQVVIHLVHTGKDDEIYLASHSSDITFDLDGGLPVREYGTGTQGYGFVGTMTSYDELKEVTSGEPARLNQMDGEFSTYLAAQKAVQPLFSAGDMSLKQVDAAAEQEKEILQKARAQLTTPEFQELIDKDLSQLPAMVAEAKESAQQRETLLHAPAARWKTTDLQGKPHALSDFKGKVVVLDFWYRGCGWCMLAMPQVKEVAEHFANQPVVVLGMSTDSPESKDADFVAQKMQLDYPILYAKKIAQNYHINGFPTLLILDQKGVVKDIHAGYAPDLRDEIEHKVDELLKGSATGA